MAYTVNQLALLAGITPRTLHHYDHIGLLTPAVNPKNGYRQYGEQELLRLQQILFFRELKFSLAQIKNILASPNFNPLEALADQKHMLALEVKRLNGLMKTINNTIKKLKGQKNMNDQDLYGGLTRDEMEAYQKEAQQKWGHTEAFKQSQRRVATFTKDDWKNIKEESDALLRDMVAMMNRDVTDPAVQKIVERHRQSINRFYDCTIEIYRGLAQMYLQDQRFADFYRKYHKDLPEFLSAAMLYYCNTHKK